jgi:hypothetical protein
MCGTCRDSRESSIELCERCGEFFCGDCRESGFCHVCEETKCQDCAVVKGCVRCMPAYFLHLLRKSKPFEMLRRECLYSMRSARDLFGVSRYIDTCIACSKKVCEACSEIAHCAVCEKEYCPESRPVYHFASFDSEICEVCMFPDLSCDSCDKVVCTKHLVKCDGTCERAFCNDCCKVTKCENCFKSFCTDCRMVTVLNCCSEPICVECIIPENALIETCATCDKFFCISCRDTKPCGSCDLCYWNDDYAFVDVCEQCETGYWEECAVVVRCAWCSHSACELCLRKGDFCRMCNEKPPKKKQRLTSC